MSPERGGGGLLCVITVTFPKITSHHLTRGSCIDMTESLDGSAVTNTFVNAATPTDKRSRAILLVVLATVTVKAMDLQDLQRPCRCSIRCDT